MIDWKDLEKMPPGIAGEWVGRRPFLKDIKGRAAVEKAINKWTIADSLIVSLPDSKKFSPVLCIDIYREMAHQFVMNQQRNILLSLFGITLILFAISCIKQSSPLFTAGILNIIFMFYMIIDYISVIRNINALTERALFIYWIQKNGILDLVIWLGIMLIFGMVQWIGETLCGSHESFMLKYGIVYDLVHKGQLWRLAIGTFFHSNLLHWSVNAGMLLIIGPITSFISRSYAFCVFVFGSIFGAIICVVLSSYSKYDCYTGVSAGIFAMIGYCAGISLRLPKKFPINFAITALSFGFIGIIFSWILMDNSANKAHLAGIIFGISWGLCHSKIKVS